MKHFFTWFYYLTKRQLMNVFFVLILLLIPISALGINYLSKNLEASITIGVADNDNTEISEHFVNTLTTKKGIVSIIKYDDTTSMEKDILENKLQCGYVVSDGFEEKIFSNSNEKLLEVYTTPNNTFCVLSNEIMFADIFKELGYYTLLNDLEKTNIFSNITDTEYNSLKETYNTYLSGGKTFNFNFNTTNGVYVASGNIDIISYVKTPVRGIIAVFIFIAGLAGGFTYLKDKKNGFKIRMCLYDISIPVVLACASGLISIYIVGINSILFSEIITLFLYGVLVTLFVTLLTKILSKATIYCSTIPIFALGSMICCPIFVNLSTFLPFMKVIQFIFLPSYYFIIYNSL